MPVRVGRYPRGMPTISGEVKFHQAYARDCKPAGIEDLRFHDLRHEATSRFFEKGLREMQVAAITGHKTLQMLKRYTHLKILSGLKIITQNVFLQMACFRMVDDQLQSVVPHCDRDAANPIRRFG